MPEGDSVYKLARKLDVLVGRQIARTELRVPRLSTADLSGQTLVEQATHGKHLLTRFDGGWTLHTHLEMEGSWSVVSPGKMLPRRLMPEVRVLLACVDGPTAYGLNLPVVDLVRTREEDTLVGHLGPDLLSPDFDIASATARLLREPDRPIVSALLDQRNLAGLGNLWVNELSYLRGISPWTRVGDVDLDALIALARRTLKHSALVPGAYQVTTGSNRRGEDHWVAGRRGRPCRRCGTEIQVVAEVPNDPDRRRTWWCPRCQPGPGPDR